MAHKSNNDSDAREEQVGYARSKSWRAGWGCGLPRLHRGHNVRDGLSIDFGDECSAPLAKRRPR